VSTFLFWGIILWSIIPSRAAQHCRTLGSEARSKISQPRREMTVEKGRDSGTRKQMLSISPRNAGNPRSRAAPNRFRPGGEPGGRTILVRTRASPTLKQEVLKHKGMRSARRHRGVGPWFRDQEQTQARSSNAISGSELPGKGQDPAGRIIFIHRRCGLLAAWPACEPGSPQSTPLEARAVPGARCSTNLS
jgi:hypothetical protein